MNKIKTVLVLIVFFLLTYSGFAQNNIAADTTLARNHFKKALLFENSSNLDSARFYYQKTSDLYLSLTKNTSLPKNYATKEYLKCLYKLSRTYLLEDYRDTSFKLANELISYGNAKFGDNTQEVASAYNILGIIYERNGDNGNAINNYLKALKIRIELFNENHSDVGMSYYNIGHYYLVNGKFDLALEYTEKALSVYIKVFGLKNFNVANTYGLIGTIYQNKNNFNLALENFKKALSIRHQLFGEKSTEVIFSFNEIANLYKLNEDYVNALDLYLKSLQIEREIFGEENSNVADTYENIGHIYFLKEDYKLALENYFKALNIRKDIYGDKHLNVANGYVSIGLSYNNLEEFNLALDNFLIAESIYKGLLGDSNASLASVYIYMGFNYQDTKEYDLAEDCFLKALMIRVNLMGEDNELVATTYNLIGYNYEDKREYSLALDNFLKALNIRQKLFGDNDEGISSSYNNVGDSYRNLGDYNSALKFYLRQFQIDERLLGENNPDLILNYGEIGLCQMNSGKIDSALETFQKVLKIIKENYGEKNKDLATCYNNIGECYRMKGDYDLALKNQINALNIRIELFGENHVDVAMSYLNLGSDYLSKGEYKSAIEFFEKAINIYSDTLISKSAILATAYNNLSVAYQKLGNYDLAIQNVLIAHKIREELFGTMHPEVVTSLVNIGFYYHQKGDFKLALKFYFKALEIDKRLFGEHHPDVVTIYLDIGEAYRNNGQYDLALEYFLKSLSIGTTFWGEKNPSLASCYFGVGVAYHSKGEIDLGMQYYQKALLILEEILGVNNPDVASCYSSIGLIYVIKGNYNLATEYYLKAMNIYKNAFGETHPSIALNYYSMGLVFAIKGEYDISIPYYKKSIEIYKECFGEKHPSLAMTYNYLGLSYYNDGKQDDALKYFQLALYTNLKEYTDSANVKSNPVIKDFSDPYQLVQSLYGKASAYYKLHNLKESFINIQLCDSVISKMRETSSLQSDKMGLGISASQILEGAVQLCFEMSNNTPASYSKSDLLEQAFYFSEKNKALVLLESLANQENLVFAGIPDSLLQKENALKVDINFYQKKLEEEEDEINKDKWHNQLFGLNRQYDELISKLETNYPNYFNLKYTKKNITLKNIQSIINDKTAICSYFVGDSSIYIITLTKSDLKIQEVDNILNLNDSIVWFRHGLTKTSSRMQENYRRLGYYLFSKLFPDIDSIDKNIQNLIIIPDGVLATLPFESLLTEDYSGDINMYKEYPFLIKEYNISYSYSANLYYLTFSKEVSSTSVVTKLNDWIGFAPAFDDSDVQSMITSTTGLKRRLNGLKTDSLMINRSMFDRTYITPLPGTITETGAIFKLYDKNKLNAKVLLHNNANEQFIKSGELEKYKVLHFATHGFVNSEWPELSGLLLAQDTTGGEDGILFSGEIYNLKINADLVVLSACETGLGKIQKGEGIIGLTRALLYAGAKNIIVSLWQVTDQSTSDLMVSFYKNKLENKSSLSYSEALRQAKLKMIGEEKYAHPLYWSPFILIGK